MKPGFLQDRLPRSLYGRAALIILLPILFLQIVVSVSFVQRHYADVTRQMARGIVLELGVILDITAEAPEEAAALGERLGLTVALPPETPVPEGDRTRWIDLSGRALIETLRDDLTGVLAVDLTARRVVRLWLETPRGPVEVSFARQRIAAANPHQLLVLMVVLGLILSLVAFFFLRNELRPIRRLARAAMAFGRGEAVPYRPGGAAEVRAAGQAFLEMRNRIERQAQTRNLMLSGISHDLRTPLTRLRLGLALMEEGPETEDLRRDLDEMEHMLDAFLDYAREGATERAGPADLVALLRQVGEDAGRGGQSVGLSLPEGQVTLALRPGAMRRAVENLVANGLRYGKRVELSLVAGERTVRVLVEDDGPGIPPDQREVALRPFVRLDAARNQDQGSGVGLGLSIVADIARVHGGHLRLGESAGLGGLRAELILPR